jgi:ribose transport system substrate-binding protein
MQEGKMKKMKKLIVTLVAVLALGMLFSGCSPAEDNQAEEAPPAADSEDTGTDADATEPTDAAPVAGGKIAVSLPPADNVWQAKMLTSIEEAVKEYPDIEWTVKAAVDDNDQLNQLTAMKDGGYDLIIALPNDGDLMTPICEQIYDAGIKTIILDRDIASGKYTAYVGGDNPGAGRGSAEFLGDYLGGKGKIAVLRCIAGSPSDLDINNNFMDVLKDKYPDIEVVVEGDGEYDSQHGLDAMSNILPAYDEIDAVFAQDDEAALGAITAIKNANREDIKLVVGIGGKLEAYEMIKADNDLFKCSLTYLPDMGVDAVKLAAQIMAGESFEKDNVIESVAVTKDNVDEYMGKAY